MRVWANNGYLAASERLAALLAAQGHTDELRTRADVGDWAAARRWADLLAEQGRVDHAIRLLRSWADAGDRRAAGHLTDMFANYRRVDELRAWSRVSGGYAAERLADLLRITPTAGPFAPGPPRTDRQADGITVV